MRGLVLGAQGQRDTREEPVMRAVMGRAVNSRNQAEETGFLAGGLQGDFRASLNSGEKKMILFARISSRNLTFSFIMNMDKTP